MARPVKPRATYDREFGQLLRLRRVVQADTVSAPAWRTQVDVHLRELVVLFLSEDTRRRAAPEKVKPDAHRRNQTKNR